MATRSSGAAWSPKALAASVRPPTAATITANRPVLKGALGVTLPRIAVPGAAARPREMSTGRGAGGAEGDEHRGRVGGDEGLGDEAGREVGGGRGREQQPRGAGGQAVGLDQ